ncbi:hypothetical protein K504DRAFT_268365 [Pleomassaria siparia CBS 279.74]|uniref:Uncharacterized protein n=1 Tax=Pleomassaria siparia CBS 279.74 TaxID=1314801 RepID=A0A6G1K9M9_9PLEO|nr:hypothetical protein K504DRAFT_268365 [Pleomassaria siparia CBS 279.74]
MPFLQWYDRPCDPVTQWSAFALVLSSLILQLLAHTAYIRIHSPTHTPTHTHTHPHTLTSTSTETPRSLAPLSHPSLCDLPLLIPFAHHSHHSHHSHHAHHSRPPRYVDSSIATPS